MHSLSESSLRIIRFVLVVKKIEKKYFHFENYFAAPDDSGYVDSILYIQLKKKDEHTIL